MQSTITSAASEAKPLEPSNGEQHWSACVGSTCHNDGCRVEKFSRLVVARCLTGRHDTSPYGRFSPPDASRPSRWLSHALLVLYKVKSCILSRPWPTCWKSSVWVYIPEGQKLVPSASGNCAGMTMRQLITWLENKKDGFYAFRLDFWYTNKVADYFASLLHADWSFKEVMKSWCVLLLGLYLARGACMSLIEGSLWHGCSGPPHLGASSGSRWGEIRRG